MIVIFILVFVFNKTQTLISSIKLSLTSVIQKILGENNIKLLNYILKERQFRLVPTFGVFMYLLP